MKECTREEPGILAAAERQMHAWAVATDLKNRAMRRGSAGLATERALKYIAISREVGVGGGPIGRAVGEQLGWRVFDNNLLDYVADRFHLPRIMLDLVDETRSNWVFDVLGTWMDRKVIPHERFVALLSRVVHSAAQGGEAVFVGRGVQFLLPRKELLAVRLVASPQYRVRQIMAEQGKTESEARHCVAEVDRGRREFAERFFHHDITDPHLYDLVINVERRGRAETVQEIVAAIER